MGFNSNTEAQNCQLHINMMASQISKSLKKKNKSQIKKNHHT